MYALICFYDFTSLTRCHLFGDVLKCDHQDLYTPHGSWLCKTSQHLLSKRQTICYFFPKFQSLEDFSSQKLGAVFFLSVVLFLMKYLMREKASPFFTGSTCNQHICKSKTTLMKSCVFLWKKLQALPLVRAPLVTNTEMLVYRVSHVAIETETFTWGK